MVGLDDVSEIGIGVGLNVVEIGIVGNFVIGDIVGLKVVDNDIVGLTVVDDDVVDDVGELVDVIIVVIGDIVGDEVIDKHSPLHLNVDVVGISIAISSHASDESQFIVHVPLPQ